MGTNEVNENTETVQVATFSKCLDENPVLTALLAKLVKEEKKSTPTTPTSPPEGEKGMQENAAWKVVGSPARRASAIVLSLPPGKPVELEQAPNSRARAASMVVNGTSSKPQGLTVTPSSAIWEEEKFYVSKNESASKSPANGEVQDKVLTVEEYEKIPQRRIRSHSSSAIFGLETDSVEGEDTLPDMSSIWAGQNRNSEAHRRASTQSNGQNSVWEGLRASQLATRNDMNGQNADDLMNRFKQQQQQNVRRYSVAPSMVNRFIASNVEEDRFSSEDVHIDGRQTNGQLPHARRHSMAGPTFERKPSNAKSLSEGLEALGLNNGSRQLQKIDDYFENTESRSKAFREAGKNLQANQHLVTGPEIVSPALSTSDDHTWPLYVVEFKAGRTDYFFLPAELAHVAINIGDLAIVEADRGKDLGKVIEANINSMQDLQLYQMTHEDPLVDSHNAVGKEIHPKRLFRLAKPNEVAMLLQKNQDESKANGVCQVKIRQKKLPMEIVDAEYQWDRRKLTFYFVADGRIDFRELVRELFKIYKTRIWMCAVQPTASLDAQ